MELKRQISSFFVINKILTSKSLIHSFVTFTSSTLTSFRFSILFFFFFSSLHFYNSIIPHWWVHTAETRVETFSEASFYGVQLFDFKRDPCITPRLLDGTHPVVVVFSLYFEKLWNYTNF